MDSGSGFLNDLRIGSRELGAARRAALADVRIPTLVLASRHDGGVRFAHAESDAATIPGARLVDSGAPSHLFWLGSARATIRNAIVDMLGI